VIYIGLVGVNKGYGWGKTWLGRDLEWQIRNAGFNLGPFSVKAQFFLSNAGLDSNIYFGATDEPVKDYTLTAGPAFDIYFSLKRKVIFHVYESPRYVYYKETKRERTWNNYFRGEVYFVFNRFVLSTGAGRSEAKERWNTETDIPIFRREDSVQGSIFWQPASRTSFNLGYGLARYDYGETDLLGVTPAEKLNRNETFLKFAAYREINSRTRLFLEVEYGLFDFANPSIMKDSNSYASYGGFEFSPFGNIRGRVKIGYKYFDSKTLQGKDYRGIVGDSNISVKLMNPLAIRASYRRDIQFSIWYESTYFLESRYGIGGSLYVSKNIRLDYDYNRSRNDYPQEFGVEIRRDDFTIHAVGIYFRLRENTAFGVIASRSVRDSNLDWRDDSRDFVGFNLTYGF
jgi:hypothetical protein